MKLNKQEEWFLYIGVLLLIVASIGLSYCITNELVQMCFQTFAAAGFIAVACRSFYLARHRSQLALRLGHWIITVSSLTVVYSIAIDLYTKVYLLNSPSWTVANIGLCIGFFTLLNAKKKYPDGQC